MLNIQKLLKLTLAYLIFFTFVMSPFLVVMYFIEALELSHFITRMNLFFLGLFACIGIVYLITPVLQKMNLFEKNILSLNPQTRAYFFEVISWTQRHQTTTFALLMLGILALSLPLIPIAIWVDKLELATSFKSYLLLVLMEVVFLIPSSILGSIYDIVTRPKHATPSEVERLMKEIHQDKEITKERIESAMHIFTIKPNKTLLILTSVLLIIAVLLMELSSYGLGGIITGQISAYLMAIVGMFILSLFLFGKKVSELESMIDEET